MSETTCLLHYSAVYGRFICWLLLPAALLLGVIQAHAGLVLHYAFDETSVTTAADSSGSGNTGTLTNMTGSEWTTGKVGGVLSFDGTNDYVEAIGYKGVTGSNARTIALWFKTSNSGALMPLAAYGDRSGANSLSYLALVSDSAAFVWGSGVHGGGKGDLVDGAWHHVAVTIPENGIVEDFAFYVDGAGGPTGMITPPINTSASTDVILGSWTGTGVGKFNGLLDDFRIYDHALSAGEVAALAAMSTTLEPASVFASLGLLAATECGLREWRRR